MVDSYFKLSEESPNKRVISTQEMIKSCFYHLIKLAWPSTLTYLIQICADISSYHYVGRLSDPLNIATLTLGTTTLNMFSISLAFGLNMGIDTLVTQHYGKKEFHSCSLILYRSIIFGFMICSLSLLLILNSEAILTLFSVEKVLAQNVEEYIKAGMIYIYAVTFFDQIRRFLTGQRIVKPQLYITITTSLLQILHCALFVHIFGLKGVIYSMTTTQILNIISLIIYIYRSKCCVNTLVLPTNEVFLQISQFLKYAISSTIMFWMEAWSLQALNIICGSLGSDYSAANGISLNINLVFYTFASGIGAASCTLVGNSLGEKKGSQAKMFARVGLASIIFISIIFSFILYNLQNLVFSFYMNNDHIKELFVANLPILMLAVIFDNTQGVGSRILVGMGKQIYSTISNIIAYIIFMIPLALILKSSKKIRGLWMALLFAYLLTSVFFIFTINLYNFDLIADRISKNISFIKDDDDKGEDEVVTNIVNTFNLLEELNNDGNIDYMSYQIKH